MEWIELGKLANIEIGKTPARKNSKYWKGDYTWVSIADMKDKYISSSKEKISKLALKETNIKIVPKGTVIMSFKLSIGKRAITEKKLYTNEAISAFHIKDGNILETNYLYYALGFVDLMKDTDRAVMGKTLNKSKLNQIKIPVPPMEIQEKIVKVLDQAQALIDKRKEQIEALDQLIESIFYTMFGDPVRNEKGWELKSWDKIFNTTTGKLNSNAMDANGKYPFFTCAKEVFRIDNYSYDCEALLLAGNNASADYDVKYYKGKFDAYQRTYILTLKEYNNYLYFKEVLENYLLEMKQISKGTNTRYLTLKLLNTFNLPVPPISLQNEFEDKVETIEKQKELLNQSLELLEENYKSIMDKAFKGQLFN